MLRSNPAGRRRKPPVRRSARRALPFVNSPSATLAVAALATAALAGLQLPQAGTPAESTAGVGGPTSADSTALLERRAGSLDEQSLQATRSREQGRQIDEALAERLANQQALADEQARLAAAAAAAQAAADAAAAEQARLAEAARTSWVRPVEGYRVTGGFGDRGRMWDSTHSGLDLAAPTGTPVVTTAAGEVVASGWAGGYGLKVQVRHEDGTETYYAHLSTASVEVGDVVAAGEQLGEVGSTGNSSGPHLHLEVRLGGTEIIDPVPYLAERGVTF